jgi:hypothetical protein
MNDWYSDIKHETKSITNIGIRLEELAKAAETLGNNALSNELFEYADSLKFSAKAINYAISENLIENVRQAERNSLNILNSALAGYAIGAEDDEIIDTMKDTIA